MTTFAGKVAIVTGASLPNGIGFAAARLMAANGAKVVLTGRNEASLRDCVRAIEGESGAAILYKHDVADEDSWARLWSTTMSEFGQLDILINNAGLSIRNLVETYSIEDWRDVVDTNLTGVFLGCRMAIGVMRSGGRGGSIVNVSSVAATKAMAKSGAYGATKAGVRQLTRIVALEGAEHGIRCNAVYPGLTETDFIKEASKDRKHMDALVASLPFRRPGSAQEVANCIAFLASDDASYVSGADLVVDGALAVG